MARFTRTILVLCGKYCVDWTPGAPIYSHAKNFNRVFRPGWDRTPDLDRGGARISPSGGGGAPIPLVGATPDAGTFFREAGGGDISDELLP